MNGQDTRKTLLLGCYFPRSAELEGVGTFVMGLAEGMVQAGWRVRLVLPEGRYRPLGSVEIATYRSGLDGLMRYRVALQKGSAGADAALLVENNPNLAFVAGWTQVRKNTFCYFYTPFQRLGEALEMGLSRQAVKHAAAKSALWSRWRKWRRLRCIVPTEFQAAQLRRFENARVRVLAGTGLSREQVIPDRAAARRRLGWNDRPVIGYLGHYSRVKGVDVLMGSFVASGAQGDLAVAYSGKGRLGRRAARHRAAALAAGRLRELGVLDPLTFLAACDVVALPYATSSIHHLPQVMIESFAAGTAVITTDVGGLNEVHADGVTGTVVPARDGQALAKALCRACDDRQNFHQMGRNARRVFESRLCREVFCQELTQVLGDSSA